MSARTLPEWIGKTPDEKVPTRVRVRVFDRYGGKCHLTGRKLMISDDWDLDHVVALINGGEHRESNLAPALRDKHRAKTAEDVAEKARVASLRAKHIGAETPRRSRLQGHPFPKAPPQRSATRPLVRRGDTP